MKSYKYIIMLIFITLYSSIRANQFFFATGVPKSGTRLLNKALKLITEYEPWGIPEDNTLIYPELISLDNVKNQKQFLFAHIIYEEDNIAYFQKNNFKGIMIMRDPRDEIVSFAYYVDMINFHPMITKLSMDKRISHLISDMSFLYSHVGRWKNPLIKNLQGIDTFYALFDGWLRCPFVYTTRFEDLVGSKGGGSDEKQIQEVINIGSFLNFQLTENQAILIAKKLFGNQQTLGTFPLGTFRSGQIGSWKQHFNEDHKQMFKKVAGQLLIDLGYEKDFDW